MRHATENIAAVPLGTLQVGAQVCVDYVDDAIDPIQREQLAAYGLAPHHRLSVLQQRPMTIVMVDQVELALESSVVGHVWAHTVPVPQLSMGRAFSRRAARRPARRPLSSKLSPVIVVLACLVEKAKHLLLLGGDGI